MSILEEYGAFNDQLAECDNRYLNYFSESSRNNTTRLLSLRNNTPYFQGKMRKITSVSSAHTVIRLLRADEIPHIYPFLTYTYHLISYNLKVFLL